MMPTLVLSKLERIVTNSLKQTALETSILRRQPRTIVECRARFKIYTKISIMETNEGIQDLNFQVPSHKGLLIVTNPPLSIQSKTQPGTPLDKHRPRIM